MDGRSMSRPRAGGVDHVRVLIGAADTGKDETTLVLVDHFLGVQVVHPVVGRQAGHGDSGVVAAPVEPPKGHAVGFQRLLQGEIGLRLRHVAPVPCVAGRVAEAPAVGGQVVAGDGLRFG